ncbi:UNVERIFIED_CONTAM: Centrosomal protein poc5 [Siphonaria sp. JEL0065]|nr:Centrosomal protein poc5 [Siphonaria sp. JEL0065]
MDNLIQFESRSPSPEHPHCLVLPATPVLDNDLSTVTFNLPVNATLNNTTTAITRNASPTRLFSIANRASALLDRIPSSSFKSRIDTANTITNQPASSNSDTQPSTSTATHNDSSAAQPDLPPLDPDASRFNASLQKWSSLFSRAVLADFLDSRTAMCERHVREVEDSGRVYVEAVEGLNRRVIDLEQVLNVFKGKVEMRNMALEGSVCSVIGQLNNRNTCTKFFSQWKSEFQERKRMHLAERVADQKAKAGAMRRALFGWQRVCGVTWRRAVEKSIRIEAEKAMEQLSIEYEQKIKELEMQVNKTKTRLNQSEMDRARAQGDMKKALMRGVCALNMEAMSVFRPANANNTQFQQPPFIPDFPPTSFSVPSTSATSEEISPTSTNGTLLNQTNQGHSQNNNSEGIDISPISTHPIPRGQRSVIFGDAATKIYPIANDSIPNSLSTSPVLNHRNPSLTLHLPQQPLFLKKQHLSHDNVGNTNLKEEFAKKRGPSPDHTTITTTTRKHSTSMGKPNFGKPYEEQNPPPPLVQKAVNTSMYKSRGDSIVGVHVTRHQ